MNEIQQAEFEILKYFDDFARKNGINYFLYAGTLLGSVRHKGFIPWDDDIDVAMVREDFEKFEDLFCKSNYVSDGYIYQSRKVYPYTAMEFSKIRSKELNIKEIMPKTQKGNQGAWLDIFALDKVPEDRELRKKQFEKVEFYNYIIKKTLLVQVEQNDRGVRRILKGLTQFLNERFHKIYFFLPYVFRKRYQYMTMYNNTDTKLVADLSYLYHRTFDNFEKNVYDKSSFTNLTNGNFQGENFPIPSGYDAMLKTLYGNYMELPPEEERKVHKIEYIEI